MSRRTEFATAMCTVGCALGIGFIMQSGDVADLRYGSGSVSSISTMPIVGEPVAPIRVRDMTIGADGTLLEVRQMTLTSADVKLSNVFEAQTNGAIAASVAGDELLELFDPDIGLEPECELTALAKSQEAAKVTLTLAAPCYAGEPILVTQAQQTISETLDAAGILELELPVLEDDTEISIAFQNGERITAFVQ